MVAFIYHPGYYSDVGAHVLQTQKYKKTYERFQRENNVPPDSFHTPRPAIRWAFCLSHRKSDARA
jgi:hypothetical protein